MFLSKQMVFKNVFLIMKLHVFFMENPEKVKKLNFLIITHKQTYERYSYLGFKKYIYIYNSLFKCLSFFFFPLFHESSWLQHANTRLPIISVHLSF